MILIALSRATAHSMHPAALRVLLRSLALTLALFLLLGVGAWYGIDALLIYFGWANAGLAGAAAAVLMLLGGWLLFRAVAIAVISLFGDEIVAAVETESYPEAAKAARPVGLIAGLRMGLASLGRTLLWNLLALPLYIALLVTGVGTFALLLALNAYLLGKDLAAMVEARHPQRAPFRTVERLQLGLASALLFLIPLINLFAPIWSAAMAVHMFHRRNSRDAVR